MERDSELIKKYKVDIGSVEVFENYMIANLNEGITLTIDTAIELIYIADIHFSTQDFIYITCRKNSYAVDPTLYTKVAEIPTLKGIAIVSDKIVDRNNLNVERLFFDKPMMLFESVTDATDWAELIIG